LDIVKKREQLQLRIDAFHAKVSSFLVDVELDGGENKWVTNYSDDLEDPDDNPFKPLVQDDSELLEPENVPIILPSIWLEWRHAFGPTCQTLFKRNSPFSRAKPMILYKDSGWPLARSYSCSEPGFDWR
jgi:hypothetical protein